MLGWRHSRRLANIVGWKPPSLSHRSKENVMADTRRTVTNVRFMVRVCVPGARKFGAGVATAAVLALLWMSMVAPALYRAGALSRQQTPPSGTKPAAPAPPAPPTPLRAQPGIQLAVPAPISPSSVVTSGGPAPFMVGAPGMPGGLRFSFKIDPKTPLADLLPVPPKSQ